MKIAILLYNGMTMLDAIGPYEVLSRLPDAEVVFVARKKGEIVSDTQALHLNAKYQFKDVTSADILVVPGSTISFIKQVKDTKTLTWLKEVHETTKWTTSVCTGSIILAAAGLLNGLKATSHWYPLHMLEEYGAIPVQQRFVKEGKIITSAGVSAGIDMALYLAREIAGEDVAKSIQLMIEYNPQPPVNSGDHVNADEKIIEMAEKKMEAEAKEELSFFDKVRSFRTIRKIRSKNK